MSQWKDAEALFLENILKLNYSVYLEKVECICTLRGPSWKLRLEAESKMLQRPCAAHENSSLSTCAEVKLKFWDMLPKHMKAIFVMRQRNRYYSVSLKNQTQTKNNCLKTCCIQMWLFFYILNSLCNSRSIKSNEALMSKSKAPFSFPFLTSWWIAWSKRWKAAPQLTKVVLIEPFESRIAPVNENMASTRADVISQLLPQSKRVPPRLSESQRGTFHVIHSCSIKNAELFEAPVLLWYYCDSLATTAANPCQPAGLQGPLVKKSQAQSAHAKNGDDSTLLVAVSRSVVPYIALHFQSSIAHGFLVQLFRACPCCHLNSAYPSV